MIRAAFCLSALFSGVPAAAQGVDLVEACLASAPGWAEKHACIGLGARACWEAEGSSAPIIVGPCLGEENAFWAARVTAAMGVLRARADETDADHRDFGWPDNVAESLNATHAAWATYRDAACDYVTAEWGQGSGSGPAWMECVMQKTAEHVLWLAERIAQY